MKTLDEYVSLPYTMTLRRDTRDAIFVARVEELPGCSAHGGTEQEAIANLRDNMREWIGDCLESGDPIPEPAAEVELPSGKWLQRVPRSLHLKLIRLAKDEGVSLNQLVTSALSETVGARSTLHLGFTASIGQQSANWGRASHCAIRVGEYDVRSEIGLPALGSPEAGAFLTPWNTELNKELPLELTGKQRTPRSRERNAYAERQASRNNFQN